jgi:hypothetical protein
MRRCRQKVLIGELDQEARGDGRLSLSDPMEDLLCERIRQVESDLAEPIHDGARLCDHPEALRRKDKAECPEARDSQERGASSGGQVVEDDLGVRIAVSQCENRRLSWVQLAGSHRFRDDRAGHNRQPAYLSDDPSCGIVIRARLDLGDYGAGDDHPDPAKP